MKKLFVHSLDLTYVIRGLLTLIIIFHHSFSLAHKELTVTNLLFLSMNGRTAVWMFFFLSGYVLANVYLSGKYNLSKTGILQFYVKRILKILPLYLLIIYICYLLTPVSFPNRNSDLLKLLFFIRTGPTELVSSEFLWFMLVLVRLYVIAPLGFLFIKLLDSASILFRFSVLCVVLITGIIIRRCLLSFVPLGAAYTSSFSYIDIFFGGMVLATVTGHVHHMIAETKPALRISAVLAAVILFLSFFAGGNYMRYIYRDNYPPVYFIITPMISATVISLLLLASKPVFSVSFTGLKKSMTNAYIIPLQFFGVAGIFSYEIYMFHVLIIGNWLYCSSSCTTPELLQKTTATLILSLGIGVLYWLLQNKLYSYIRYIRTRLFIPH